MLSFRSFLAEEKKSSEITAILNQRGYPDIKVYSGSRVAVLTDDNRSKVSKKLFKDFEDANPKYVTIKGHSMDAVRVFDKYDILVKPKSKQGTKSAGIENEEAFKDVIEEFASAGPIKVVFTGSGSGAKKYTVKNVESVRTVGTDTSDRKKADLILKTADGDHNISLKKSNAEMWESGDKLFGPTAKKIIDKAVQMGEAELVQVGSKYQLKPNLAVPMNDADAKKVIFGSDIEGKGAVITKTLKGTSYRYDAQAETLYIKVDGIIKTLRDVRKTKYEPFLLMRNDSTRNTAGLYPGIRVVAVYRKRLTSTTKVLDL